ncbi:MAG: phosphate signaling complex protein PhoU [Bifidobacteriaceae bacterium]|jgi:phosphate transport system protein|nr:phosphate signaling complex protein PhoU [Bifidobacteriaceae bacterium]MCI1979555.1 phosphate signaling complex protein PhoU [Bifidobacteriaceae bacterium]
MRVLFNEELKQVADDLEKMVTLVQTAIGTAGKALLDSDIEAAQSVIDGDVAIDDLEVSIVDQCVQLLAKQNPVATDLRVIVSTLRLASTFERMGDLARHIAEAARRSYPDSGVPAQARDIFVKMQKQVEHIAAEVMEMLANRDTKTAEEIIEGDDVLDKLHHMTFSVATDDSWKGTTQDTINLVLLGRYYERFGDHAVSAARRVIYIVSGFDPNMVPEHSGEDPD